MEKLAIKGHTFGAGAPLICVPIMEASEEDVLRETKRLTQLGAEMLEWRVDAFAQMSDLNAVRKVLRALAPIVSQTVLVFTFRSKSQGGLAHLTQEEIRDLHWAAAESGAVDLIDVEYFSSRHPKREIAALQRMGVRVIASHHDFEQTPHRDVIRMVLGQMNVSGADVVKLALMPKDAADVLTLLEETNAFHEEFPNRPIITMSMGPLGVVSRVAGEAFGSCVTFGAGGKASAPGQLPMDELKQVLSILHNSGNGGECA